MTDSKPRHRAFNRYGAAVGSVLTCLALKLLISPHLPQAETPFLFFSAAVLVSAWYGGFRPGLLTVVLSTLLVVYFFLPPEQQFSIRGADMWLRLGMFLIEGLIISVLVGALHVERESARDSAAHAEEARHKMQETLLDLNRVSQAREVDQARFRRLVNSNIIGVYFGGVEGEITDANQAFLRLLGYDREDLFAGRLNAKTLTPPEFTDADRHALRQIQEHGKCESYEKELICKDGGRVPVLLGAARLRDTEDQVVCFALDLSEQKHVEAELQAAKELAETASRTKSEFMANISHELRTPMNSIIGMTQLALEEELDPQLRDYLETAEASADSLLQLLNEVLDFSKIEAGKFRLDSEPFRLRENLDEAVKLLSIQAAEKDLELACHIPVDTPDRLIGDSHRLRQVITNLIGNGIKFTPSGEVVLSLKVASQTSDEVVLQFTVADTGIGISPQDQEAIFAPFTQVDATTTRQYGGTGLGLAISTELIRMMGGHLWVESDVGQGSQFHFTARFGRSQAGSSSSSRPVLPLNRLKDLKILVVDDNPTNRKIIEESLKSWNMTPVMSADAASAMKMLREAADAREGFPLVILDALMPQTDGFTLAQWISDDPKLAKATILMLSSAHRQTYRERCRKLDIAAYLEKPISHSDLLDAICEALNVGPPEDAAVARIDAQNQPGRPLRVLLAEDTPANQKVVCSILNKRGHQVDVVPNGQQAVESVSRHNFDVVLMDVQMPVLDGLRATEAIRAQEDSNSRRRIPIIAMTAHAMRGDRQRCLAAGMDAYIAKPLDARKLIELMESVTDEHENGADTAESVSPPAEEATSQGQTSMPSTDICDLNGALNRLAGDQELLREMIQFYLEDSPKLLEEIRAGIENRQPEDIHRAAHSLKGLSANFGAQAAVSAALQMEELGKQPDVPAAARLLPKLENEVQQLQQALNHQ